MDELLEQFLIEAPELVQQASDDLIALERDPGDAARIDSAFRAVHTLKGSVALFDFAPMGMALHAAEELLGVVRTKKLSPDNSVITALLDCVSACGAWVESIANSGILPPDAHAQSQRISRALLNHLRADGEASEAAPTNMEWVTALLALESDALVEIRHEKRMVTAVRYVPDHGCFFQGIDPIAPIRAVPHLMALRVEGRTPWSTEGFDPYVCNLVIDLLSAAPVDDVRRIFASTGGQTTVVEIAPGTLPTVSKVAHADPRRDAASRTLRVDSERVDALVDILGELIVAKNGLAHLATQAAAVDTRLARALTINQATIDRLVVDMHRALMNLRMVPLARTFRRLPPLVRDIASRLGKRVDLDVRGDDVEADKAVVDGLFEPLLHVLRNAVDHGIEGAAARESGGKLPTGRVTLSASREGDQIAIAVADDGPGIDPAKIRQAAKASGIRSPGVIDGLDDKTTLDLVFAPGLSTASSVTDVSGRGVGMDAVRTAIESLGGRVAINSVLKQGTTVRFTLPQAVVITTVMVVAVGEDEFGVPIDSVVETARVPADRITPIRSGAAFVMRDRTIPLVQLSSLLGLADTQRASSDIKVLVVAVGDQRIGIEVGDFAQRIDVLLRPMTGFLATMPGILGTALLGDGRVLMILDLPELIG